MTAEFDADTLVMSAETDAEYELLAAIVSAVRDGGVVEVRGVTALEFDGAD